MKFLFTFFLTILFSCNLFAKTSDKIVLKLDHNDSNTSNLSKLIKTHQKNNLPSRIVFEFYDSNAFYLKTAGEDLDKTRRKIYSKTYPNGDFYYLIGDLSDSWSESDYRRFYSVAKWLALRGFRTIINVAALEPDLQEAISNRDTSAIIWNSHGKRDGTIIDSVQVDISEKTFVENRSPNLKYVLFANCYGNYSAQKYGLRKMKNMKAEGWDGLVTSDHLFNYIFSSSFDQSLSEALGKEIKQKPTKKIET